MSDPWTPKLAPGATRTPPPPKDFKHGMERYDHSLSPEARAWVAKVTPPGYDGLKPALATEEILPRP